VRAAAGAADAGAPGMTCGPPPSTAISVCPRHTGGRGRGRSPLPRRSGSSAPGGGGTRSRTRSASRGRSAAARGGRRVERQHCQPVHAAVGELLGGASSAARSRPRPASSSWSGRAQRGRGVR
jgi:hypothetical protein